MRNPRSEAEWREAVTQAYNFLLLDSSRRYGLVQGGPEVNLERCEAILDAGRKKGIVPDTSAAGLRKFLAAVDGMTREESNASNKR